MKPICVETKEEEKRYNYPIGTWLVVGSDGGIVCHGSLEECEEHIEKLTHPHEECPPCEMEL